VALLCPIDLEPEAASRLSARDAVHLAVMQRHGITRILSFDTGFDGIVGVERIGA
jgi:predicted nucleic acid-binding protein